MCLIDEEIEFICKDLPDFDVMVKNWKRKRQQVLERLPFEKIEVALSEVDEIFISIISQRKNHAA